MPGPSLVDDLTIADTAGLWRRVHPAWIVSDDNSGGMRLSSAAFDDSADGSPLSVLLTEVIALTQRSAQDVLNGYDAYKLAAITAGTARSFAQGIARTPEPDEPAHASAFGPKTKSNKRGMAKTATWAIAPG